MNGRGLAGLALGMAAVAAISLATPDPATDHLVSWTAVPLGTTASTDRIRVTASSVTTASVLALNDVENLSTEAVFVLVQLDAAALTEQVSWVVEARTSDGRWYAERPENAGRLGATPAGFTATGTAVFQVPAERVAGLRLAVTPTGRAPISHTAGVLVELGLTGREQPLPLVTVGENTLRVTR